MNLAELRRLAEERLSAESDAVDTSWFERDQSELVRELRLQAACLELQNEELRHAQRELQAERDRSRAHAEELREREARLRAVLDTVVDGIVTLDSAGKIESLNRAAAAMFGAPPEELVGRHLSALVSPPERDATARALCCAGGRVHELSGIRRGGSEFSLELTVGAVDVDGARMSVCVLRDISESQRVDRELQESLDRFRQITERIEDVFYIADAAGRSLYVSPAFSSVFGRPPPEDGKVETALGWVDPEDQPRVREAFRRALKGDPFDEEYRIVHADGSVRILRDRAFPIEDEQGRVERLTGIVQDVTDERKLEEELRQAQKMEAIGTFVGGVAHDFNNLLMAITGCAHLALENLDSRHPAHRLVKRSADAAWRGASLTRRLLGLVRRQAHRPEQAELDTLVAASEELLRRLLGEHIRLQVETRAPGRRVLADPGELEQVLMNLAANARDAMPEGGHLRIRTEEAAIGEPDAERRGIAPGRYLALSVADTGCGMREETRARIFEPFFTTKEHGRGTGLGLSTAFAIIKQMRGDVCVASDPGRGTTFTVYLPVIDQSDHVERAAEEEVQRGNGVVLLVEDDRLVRLTVRRYLEGLGYRPVVAATPDEALRLCERLGRFDLLLTDVILPGRMGRDLAREVRARRPQVEVLYMSAHPGDELAELGWLEPGAPLLQKPFDEPALGAALGDLLGAEHEAADPATLLVVEDSDASRVAMREYLEDLGYRVLAASRPSRALELAQSEPIDLMVTDLALPEMGGEELVGRIHEIWPDAPVIVLSGYPEFVVGTRQRLLEKPVDPGRLAAEIRRSLEGR